MKWIKKIGEIEWVIYILSNRAWVLYDEDDDGKCGGGSLKGKPLTSYFTLMYRACRLAIKCTTNIDIFPFSNHTIITYDTLKYIKPFELFIFHGY